MRSTVTALRDFKAWLEQALSGFTLQRPEESGRVDQYTLTTPAVHIGLIPPGSILPEMREVRAPCLVVGLGQGSAGREGRELELIVTAVVYDPGHQTSTKDGRLDTEMNFEGYIALLTLLDRVQAALLREGAVAGEWELSSPVTLQTYETQPWPYWYGQLRFSVEGPAYPQTRFAGELH